MELDTPSYVLETQPFALALASPDYGRDFNDDGIAWILVQVQRLQPKPVLLVVHGAQAGFYQEGGDKGISHPGFAEVVAQSNLAAVISGDLHMDMDRVVHSKEVEGIHYLHIPALERTKIPDENQHTPMVRVFTVSSDDTVSVETFQVGQEQALERHHYTFSLPR